MKLLFLFNIYFIIQYLFNMLHNIYLLILNKIIYVVQALGPEALIPLTLLTLQGGCASLCGDPRYSPSPLLGCLPMPFPLPPPTPHTHVMLL